MPQEIIWLLVLGLGQFSALLNRRTVVFAKGGVNAHPLTHFHVYSLRDREHSSQHTTNPNSFSLRKSWWLVKILVQAELKYPFKLLHPSMQSMSVEGSSQFVGGSSQFVGGSSQFLEGSSFTITSRKLQRQTLRGAHHKGGATGRFRALRRTKSALVCACVSGGDRKYPLV